MLLLCEWGWSQVTRQESGTLLVHAKVYKTDSFAIAGISGNPSSLEQKPRTQVMSLQLEVVNWCLNFSLRKKKMSPLGDLESGVVLGTGDTSGRKTDGSPHPMQIINYKRRPCVNQQLAYNFRE